MTSLIFASNNPHKIQEIRAILGSDFLVSGLEELGIKEDIPEPHHTLEENAMAKAGYIFKRCKCPCFADDTGLEVAALNGQPGVLSARYAGPGKDSVANMNKLLELLHGVSDRRARFRTVIAFKDQLGSFLFEGIVQGEITRQPMGDEGFGYDPVFIPHGHNQTFAQMPASLKNMISHRQDAVQKLNVFLKDRFSAGQSFLNEHGK